MIRATSKEIRNMWFNYFKSKDHLIIPAHSLIPTNDPSLLWINSGVAALKKYFSGAEIPPSKRMANSQKSLRTNDIENVGKTSRHHTFFEMLGNFSIGDYFKDEAIEYGFEFLTKILKIDIKKLYFTVFEEDEFTYKKWISLGVKANHIFKNGKNTNFWDLGQGPCGPCTEIFYDRGPKFDKKNIGIKLLQEDIENDRYIEIWNIVFSQFNNDGNGNYTELAQKNIDTGAGLERIASISQDGYTNFESDLFMPIIQEIEKITVHKYEKENYFKNDPKLEKINLSFKVIADHLRAACIAISDGAKPGNSSREYIIRMLIRRALKKGVDLGLNKPFLHKICQAVQNTLDIYPFDVKEVSEIILIEEKKFIRTIFEGQKLFEKAIKDKKILDGKNAFKLYETYGYPIEMTLELAKERNIEVDLEGFKQSMKQHKLVSTSIQNKNAMQQQINSLALVSNKVCEFVGYDKLNCESQILYLLDQNNEVEKSNGLTYLITKETPFYATTGGQKHDWGIVEQNGNRFSVVDVFKDKYLNNVVVFEGEIVKSQNVNLSVDLEKRLGAMRNHSATHLTFSALEKVLGHKFKQSGSSLDYSKLHLDFDHFEKPNTTTLNKVTDQIKLWIDQDIKSNIQYLSRAEIKSSGVTTLEHEDYSRYGDTVRAIRFSDFSFELCGGTHVKSTSQIEDYLITNVESKKAGVFRLTALTGRENVQKYLSQEIKKEEEKLITLIDRNKKLNSNYNLSYLSNLESITLAQQTAINDNKNMQKQIQNEHEYSLNDGVLFKKYFIFYDFKAVSKLKEAATKTLDKDASLVVIIHTKINHTHRLFISTKNENALTTLDLFIKKLNGKGGGIQKIAQVVIDPINSVKDIMACL